MALAIGLVTAANAGAATPGPAFEERLVAGGLTGPTVVDWAPDGRMFIGEKTGRVWVLNPDGTREPRPLLDISAHVNAVWDRGLMGLAVDKSFETNRFLYLLYAFEDDPYDRDAPKVSRVTRVVVRPDNTVENPESPETVILGRHAAAPCPPPSNDVDCLPADFLFHNVGAIRADHDGTLWVGNGDASPPEPSDSHFRTYDERSYAGKILHVDRNGRGLPDHPFCPEDDDLDHACTKVYAKGLRNPFRFTLRPAPLPPVIADVGGYNREEIDVGVPGADYGWPCYEGDIKTPEFRDDPRCAARYAREPADPVTQPLHVYRGGVESPGAVIGGPSYTGGEYPAEYEGDVFFGDYVYRHISRLLLDEEGGVDGVETFATDWLGGVDLELSPAGRLTFVQFFSGRPGEGAVQEIAYSPGNKTPIARATATPTYGSLPLDVQFRGSESTDADRHPLTYHWDFGDDGATSTLPNPRHVYDEPGRHVATLTVDDGHGRTGRAAIAIHPGNTPPTVTMHSPRDGGDFTPGDTLVMEATGTDPQDGTLSGAALSWHVVLHHGTHTHDLQSFTGESARFDTDSGHGVDGFYEVFLTATDAGGLTETRRASVYPIGYVDPAATDDDVAVAAPETLPLTPFMADKRGRTALPRVAVRIARTARLLPGGRVRVRVRPSRTARVRLAFALRVRGRSRPFRFASGRRTLRSGRWTTVTARMPRAAARAARRSLKQGRRPRLRIHGGVDARGRKVSLARGSSRLRR